jgi:hypothetical protein
MYSFHPKMVLRRHNTFNKGNLENGILSIAPDFDMNKSNMNKEKTTSAVEMVSNN